MRRADDSSMKGDLLHVELYLMTVGPMGTLIPEARQEVHLTEHRVSRCSPEVGTLFDTNSYSEDDKNLTFRIYPSEGLITVETTAGSDKTAWRFEYVKDSSGAGYSLKEASMVGTYYDSMAKRMKSDEWVAIKGHSSSIPWPCPMAIFPIYAK